MSQLYSISHLVCQIFLYNSKASNVLCDRMRIVYGICHGYGWEPWWEKVGISGEVMGGGEVQGEPMGQNIVNIKLFLWSECTFARQKSRNTQNNIISNNLSIIHRKNNTAINRINIIVQVDLSKVLNVSKSSGAPNSAKFRGIAEDS